MPALVLASASPRRQELLRQVGFAFTVHVTDVDETPRPGEDAIALALRLAQTKARAAANRLQSSAGDERVFLGADTVVISPSGEILGKPLNAEDAARMLALLSGATHQVVTGVCVHGPQIDMPATEFTTRTSTEIAASVTWVTFHTLSQAEIAAYVATGEPMGKAGAYAIQGLCARFIPAIHGDYSNVVGLPLALVTSMLAPFGILPE